MMNGQTRVTFIEQLHHQRDNERHELQNLNDNFVRYIQRVKDLENKNRELHNQIDVLQQNWGFGSIQFKDTYNKELILLRKQIDKNQRDIILAEIQTSRGEQDKSSIEQQINFTKTFINLDQNRLSITKQELQQSETELNELHIQIKNKTQDIQERKKEMEQQLNIIQTLNTQLDNQLMDRIISQIQFETSREQLLFIKAIYEEEYNELALLGTFQIDGTQFYRTELAQAIANIRKDFQLLKQTQDQQLKEYYEIKLEQIKIEIIEQKRKKEEAINSDNIEMMDIKLIQSQLIQTRDSHKTLKIEYNNLIKSLEQLEEIIQNNRFHGNPKLIALEQEFIILQNQYKQYQTANSSLHENNISLQFEINTYRRLLEGSANVTVTKTREITLVWSNSLTSNFSDIDSKTSSVLHWEENVKVSSDTIYLPITFNGPNGSTNVSFSAIYYTFNQQIIIEANINDQFNFYNYGKYQITIYYPNSKTSISTFIIQIQPKDNICMPKQFILRDSINNILIGTIFQLQLNGQIVFTTTSDSQGIINIPQTLDNNCYDVEINTNKIQYNIAKFKQILFKNRGEQSITYVIYRQMEDDEVEFMLKWGEKPSDLDSHLIVSDGRHVYFKNTKEINVSLDCDCRKGGGPETIKVKLEPNMKYIYAVHRYTKDGQLTKSNAEVSINTKGKSGLPSPLTFSRVPNVNQPEANYWLVCQIDGTTKEFQFFNNQFEDEDNFEVVPNYFNS